MPNIDLRTAIGTAVITAFVSLWIYLEVYASGMGTLWELVMLAIVVASGYAVFGEAIMGSAIDDAQSIQGSADDEDSDDD